MKPSFREILERLNECEAEFLVVGGVAAVIQGAPLTTFDLDILIRVSADNAVKLIRALTVLEARYREHQEIIRPTVPDLLSGGHLLLMTRSGPLDVLGFIGDNKRYEDMVSCAREIDMNAGMFKVLDLEELVRQKKHTNRPKDRAAMAMLEEALKRRTKI